MLLRLSSASLALLLTVLSLPAQAQTVPQSTAEITLSFAPVVKAAAPAVVNIYATRLVAESRSPFAGDPFFDQFFEGFGPATPRLQNSLGSGVIVSPDGVVVSNYHVVGQATEIKVVLNDRREYSAQVILADEPSDLAILRLDGATDLPALPFRNSDEMEVGDLLLAIGNPFGVGQTVSSGIVSGLARSSFQVGDGRGYFIQTDAAINPGNSGGALVDMQGRLVGINTAILTKDGGSNGIGFAIPSNLVAQVVKQAAEGATRFARPWAGAAGQAMDADMAAALGLPSPEGVLLTALHPQSPLALAGLQPRDVITSLGGAPTNTPQEMLFRLASAGLGATLPLTYVRGGTPAETTITLAAAPDTPDRQATILTETSPLRGLGLALINPAVIEEFNLPLDATGTVVTSVEDFAAQTGLVPGDILLAINGTAIATPTDAATAAREPTRRWSIDLNRQGQITRLRFRL